MVTMSENVGFASTRAVILAVLVYSTGLEYIRERKPIIVYLLLFVKHNEKNSR